MKIGIFGGAFNPVHREHIQIAKRAVKKLKLDRLIIMPSAVSPHKSGKLCAEGNSRLNMCRLAFDGVDNAEVSDFELVRGGVSFTYLTCEYFVSLYPEAQKYLIVGADMLENFPKWRYPERILSNFTLVACAREEEPPFLKYKENVEALFNTSVEVIPYVGESVSSTEIRTLAALGEDFSEYVSGDVWQYINKSGLYALPNLYGVKAMLKKSRWQHSVRVAVMCAENASRIGLEEERAITMGALHDCAKCLPLTSPYLEGFTPLPDVPDPVMHQFTGAYVAEHTFGIKDEAILDAIRYHTTGRVNMTDVGMLLYLADMLESGRTFEGVEELRKIFKEDMRLCLKEALSRQVEYLYSTGSPVDGLTLQAYNYVKNH